MSRRNPMAALAGVTAAIAIAVPPAAASAQTPPTPITITPPAELCTALQQLAQDLSASGLPAITDLITNISRDIGCGGGD